MNNNKKKIHKEIDLFCFENHCRDITCRKKHTEFVMAFSKFVKLRFINNHKIFKDAISKQSHSYRLKTITGGQHWDALIPISQLDCNKQIIIKTSYQSFMKCQKLIKRPGGFDLCLVYVLPYQHVYRIPIKLYFLTEKDVQYPLFLCRIISLMMCYRPRYQWQ